MQRSRYTKYVADYPEPGQHLLFNTLTHALLAVDDELKDALETLGESEGAIPREYLDELRRQYMVVSGPDEDRENVEGYFREIKKTAESSIEVTVLTTFACNFACTYCVEDGVISSQRMSEETARRCADYISEMAGRKKVDTINLYYYGGEPLMHIPPIRTISTLVRAYCDAHGMGFAFALTTNGALLTPEVVLELKDLGLEGVKITVDGDRAHHDAKRPFKNGKGSYDSIMQNIRFAVDHIDVDIGGNFDEENFGSFEKLILDLKAEGLHKKLNKVSFKPISRTPEDRKRAAKSAELECVYSRPGTADSMIKLRKLLIDNGFKTEEGVGVNICGITLDDTQVTIDPAGKLYKCPAFVGREEFCVGTIQSGETGKQVADLWRRCIGCENVALCGDGCMYGAYIQYGDPEKLNCQMDYMNELVRENLKIEYNTHSG
jgi:uncharacterized protein